MSLHVAAFADLDAATLYGLLKLRVDVFVVEQNCPYPELDGRDEEPGTLHIWIGDGAPDRDEGADRAVVGAWPGVSERGTSERGRDRDAGRDRAAVGAWPGVSERGTSERGRDRRPVTAPRAYLRILRDTDGTAHIGRVVVASEFRGAGLATRLMDAAMAEIGDDVCELEAQEHVAAFYTRWGFAVTGNSYDLDGIPHVPMRRLSAGS